jgi:outer membrane protein TolC
MKKKLEADLISIAHRILKLKNKSELIQLHQETQKLYEKLSVLLFVENHFQEAKPTIGLAKIEEDNNKPALNLYASYSVNQVEAKRNLAINNSFDRNAPNSKIGVEFSMPLNFGLSSAIRKGSSIKASSDKIAMREKLFQQEIDWTNLQQNLHDYQENLKLAKQIEEIQKVKFENEFKLLSQGRTSTYQILAFGQELLNAELNTQNLAQKFNELIIELKLYQSENNL